MSTNTIDSKTPHAVDVHVGGRVRLRRRFLGLSQTELATAVGVTFQQVQKYERGFNRVSASKLYEIARVLKVPLSYFFEGFDGTADRSDSGSDLSPADFLGTSEGLALAEAFPRIRNEERRRKILDLIHSLADE
jgi:transcriptional regulator with XRE-family HTH domain